MILARETCDALGARTFTPPARFLGRSNVPCTLLPKRDGGKLKFKPPPPLDSSPLFSGLRVLEFLPLG